MAYLAPDRKTSGVMNMSARENLTMPNLRPFWKGMYLLRSRLERLRTAKWFERLGVRPGSALR